MQVRTIIACLLCMALAGIPLSADAQRTRNDKEKQRQWTSMENGPWDFAPTGTIISCTRNTPVRKCTGNGRIQIGFRVRFKEPKSNVKRIMPTRVTSEETQRQKVKKVEEERKRIEELYKEELVREADRNVDLTYASYKDEFNRMQDCITDGLLYCMKKSGGKLEYQVNELSRQNELLCADIAYIHKTGIGYELENAKRQQAYEEAKAKMEELVNRTAHLCAVAATHY